MTSPVAKVSRIGKLPITVPSGVSISIDAQKIGIKGPKGELSHELHTAVKLEHADNILSVHPVEGQPGAVAQSGTARAILANIVHGVHEGFEKKLELQGVGYRAKVVGKNLELSLGFSHPVIQEAPEGITFECPNQTEIVVKGIDKQKVGQVAANIRAHRPPEPYKGKGVRYAGEVVRRKEVKKK